MDSRRHPLIVKIPAVGHDDRHTRAYRFSFRHRRLPDQNAGHIGYGIVPSRLEDSRCYTDVARTRAYVCLAAGIRGREGSNS